MTRSVLVDKVSEKVEGLTKETGKNSNGNGFDSIKSASEGRKDRNKGLWEFQAKDKESEKAKPPEGTERCWRCARRCSTSRLGKNSRELLNS